MNVSIPKTMMEWVAQRIERGDYADVSDYLRDLIRRDQAEVDERQALIAALIAGEDSGVSQRSVPEIFEAVKQELAANPCD